MAQLMVRNVDDAVVQELKKRAARRNPGRTGASRNPRAAVIAPQLPLAGRVWRRCPTLAKTPTSSAARSILGPTRLTPHALVDTGFSLTARTASIGPERSPSAAGIPGGRGRSRDRDRVAPETGD